MRPIIFITKMDGGGMEMFCIGLLRAWDVDGREATLYASYAGGVREADIPQSVEKVCWNVRAMKSFWRLAKWLRTRSGDPCLALSQELAVVLLILKKLRLIENRIYYRESTDVQCHYGSRFKTLMKWLWPSLDGIIEQSRAGFDATCAICGGRLPQCIVVRNLLELSSVRDVEMGGADGTVRLACIGSFKPMKGQRYLLEELSNDADKDWTLSFWGNGEKRVEVEAIAKGNGLDDRVKFNDWERDKDKVYLNCDVVVVPSDYEGLPNVMIEAILRGKRVSVRPTCVGACELLDEIGVGETWPWRKAMEIPQETWRGARAKLARLCNPENVARGIADFMGVGTSGDTI